MLIVDDYCDRHESQIVLDILKCLFIIVCLSLTVFKMGPSLSCSQFLQICTGA